MNDMVLNIFLVIGKAKMGINIKQSIYLRSISYEVISLLPIYLAKIYKLVFSWPVSREIKVSYLRNPLNISKNALQLATLSFVESIIQSLKHQTFNSRKNENWNFCVNLLQYKWAFSSTKKANLRTWCNL